MRAGHAAQVREGAHVAVEKADLILPLVDPAEVAARVHQAQQEQPRLPPLGRRRRPAPRRSRPPPDRRADTSAESTPRAAAASTPPPPPRTSVTPTAMALGPQQLMQPRRRQPLLAARPLPRLGQQRLDPRRRPPPTPAAAAAAPPGAPAPPASRYFRTVTREIPSSRATGPLRPPLHQHLVPDHMHLIHPEHPLQRTPAPRTPASPLVRPSGGLLSERRMDHFPSGAPKRSSI